MLLIYLKLAWRNVFRNKRRTFIAGTAIGIGLAALIFTDALLIGMGKSMVESATGSFMGEGQIHHRKFIETQSAAWTIENFEELAARLENDPAVKNFAPRVKSFGTVSSAANMDYVMLVGVDPDREKMLSKIDDAIKEGSFFGGADSGDILLGDALSHILRVELGDRVVVTVSNAKTGEISQELFRVSGLFKLGIKAIDRSMAFVRIDKARQLLGIDGNNEIAMNFTDAKLGGSTQNPFWQNHSSDNTLARGWAELIPEIAAVIRMSDFSIYIIALLLFGVVALGIINTLFMSMHERIFEFGVLRAVGTRPSGVAGLIFIEAGILSVVSIGLGMIFAAILLAISTYTGIDYRGVEVAGATLTSLLYPEATLKQFTVYPLWLFLFTLLSGIYPAVYAAKIRAAFALRKTI